MTICMRVYVCVCYLVRAPHEPLEIIRCEVLHGHWIHHVQACKRLRPKEVIIDEMEWWVRMRK